MPNTDLLFDNMHRWSSQTIGQCNFSHIGGNANGTYQFHAEFNGFNDIAVEFQKATDLTLTNCTNTYAYLDYILVIKKDTVELHKEKIQTVLTKLDEEKIPLFFDNCKFACKQVEWLGYKINS